MLGSRETLERFKNATIGVRKACTIPFLLILALYRVLWVESMKGKLKVLLSIISVCYSYLCKIELI